MAGYGGEGDYFRPKYYAEQRKVENLESRKAALQKEVTDLKSQIHALTLQVNECALANRDMNGRSADLLGQLQKCNATLQRCAWKWDKLRKSNVLGKSQLAQTREERDALTEDVRTLRAHLELANRDVNDLNSQLQQNERTIDRTRSDVKNATCVLL